MHVINLGHFGKQLLSKEGQVLAPADAKASWTPFFAFWTKTAVGVRLVDRSWWEDKHVCGRCVDGGMQRG